MKYKGTTTKDGEMKHRHDFEIDENGNGKTVNTYDGGENHTHAIKNFKVLEAGPDKHPHNILRFAQLKRKIKNAKTEGSRKS